MVLTVIQITASNLVPGTLYNIKSDKHDRYMWLNSFEENNFLKTEISKSVSENNNKLKNCLYFASYAVQHLKVYPTLKEMLLFHKIFVPRKGIILFNTGMKEYSKYWTFHEVAY